MRKRSHYHRSGGFTLVELLIVLAILAMLAGLVFGAVFQAQIAAREERTKGLIAKLHGQIMSRYDSYKFRRIPVTIPVNTQPAAQRRLQALRDLMRFEMPDRYSDFMSGTNPRTPPSTSIANTPAIALAYHRRYTSNRFNGAPRTPTTQHEAAECLYLILTMGMGEEGLSAYELSNLEIGDVDSDGMPEFLDGWGNPIVYIRSPVRFISELQPLDPATGTRNPAVTPDPFDVRKVDIDPGSGAYRGLALYPLIYSRGGDGVSNVNTGAGINFTFPINASNSPFSSTNLAGQDRDAGGVVLPENQDNIHNHLIGTR